jgi:hypothetical protein
MLSDPAVLLTGVAKGCSPAPHHPRPPQGPGSSGGFAASGPTCAGRAKALQFGCLSRIVDNGVGPPACAFSSCRERGLLARQIQKTQNARSHCAHDNLSKRYRRLKFSRSGTHRDRLCQIPRISSPHAHPRRLRRQCPAAIGCVTTQLTVGSNLWGHAIPIDLKSDHGMTIAGQTVRSRATVRGILCRRADHRLSVSDRSIPTHGDQPFGRAARLLDFIVLPMNFLLVVRVDPLIRF